MQKNGLKTFVYSFSVSLFAIFAANGVYLHTRPSADEPLKISGKNVALFLRDSAEPPSYSSAPTKKIALNKLPEIAPKAANEVIFADEVSIPLSFDERETALFAEAQSAEPEIVYAETTIVESKHIPPESVERAKIYSPSSAGQDKIAIPTHIPLIEQNISSSIKEISAASPQKPTQKIVAAHNSDTADAFPIPLERGYIDDEEAVIFDGSRQVSQKQIALTDANIPLRSIENQQKPNPEASSSSDRDKWKPMQDLHHEENSPWVAAKAKGANRNQKIYEQEHYKTEIKEINNTLSNQLPAKNGVKIASETMQNLLIPIPDDIMKDKNLTPKLSFSPSDNETEQEKTLAEDTPPATVPAEDTSKNKILSSLGSLFSSSAKSVKKFTEQQKKPDILADISKKFVKSQLSGKIMPTEMRLSFQPNRAEISGQTLRWVQAFAAKALEKDTTSLEIRIDGTSATILQQKRLNLLYNILTDKGVNYSKLNTVFTQREPNSFIIRIVTKNDTENNTSSSKAQMSYYQEW